jgi:hypothetical protein
MNGHRPEVADVFRQYEDAFMRQWGGILTPHQKKAFEAIRDCRTSALGGHVDQCDECGHLAVSYNSCRNRHCPKCQAMACAKWLAEKEADLLPVGYFHVVFTLPQPIGELALRNARPIYNILFRAASETLLSVAATPKHLGAAIGCLAILHTWGQNLHLHPHLHCVVPGGGISRDGKGWISSRKSFFLPVRVLSRLFREKFLSYLQKAFRQGKLQVSSGACDALCRRSRAMEWVVFAQPPFGGPELVLKYLARYTHRVAISNRRLLTLEDGRVTFEWKDYAHGNKVGIMTLEAIEFIRRFLLHIVPRGFVRIRQFGFLANRVRSEKLKLCRFWLAAEAVTTSSASANTESKIEDHLRCPLCRTGRLVPVEVVPPLPVAPRQDSS